MLSESEKAVHLGILHNASTKVNDTRVEERIASATRTIYALVGAGMHSQNGLNPIICRKLWKCYVLPVLLYGMELWALNDKQIHKLETFQLGKLKKIQNLPDRTASVAVLGLIGQLPMEAELDMRALGLFRRVIDDKNSVEYKVAYRQLALKGPESNSWFMYVDGMLQKYNLPSADMIFKSSTPIKVWKDMVKTAVGAFWEKKLKNQANKSTIRFISEDSLDMNKPACIWTSARATPREAQKARVKVKLLCGVLRLRTHDCLWSKKKVPPTCLMCKVEPENRAHFLLRCPALTSIRQSYFRDIQGLLKVTISAIGDDEMLQTLLDPTHPISQGLMLDETMLDPLEAASRNMIFEMYRRRVDLLGYRPQKKT